MVSEDACPISIVPSHEVEVIHALKVGINSVVVRHVLSASCVIAPFGSRATYTGVETQLLPQFARSVGGLTAKGRCSKCRCRRAGRGQDSGAVRRGQAAS